MTPFDEEVVRRRLQHLARTVERLLADAPDDPGELAADPEGVAMAAAQHRLVVAAQAVADVAAHIVVSEGFGPPEDYRSAVLELGRRGIIDEDLARRMADAVGLRNVLIHLYANVDPERVAAAVGEAEAFLTFAARLERWMQGA
ncbi:MAG: hypothetical protein Kow0056_05180 [Coriobacteriia bacterium]